MRKCIKAVLLLPEVPSTEEVKENELSLGGDESHTAEEGGGVDVVCD